MGKYTIGTKAGLIWAVEAAAAGRENGHRELLIQVGLVLDSIQ